MADSIDLNGISSRESPRVEWKEGPANVDDVVKTLSAFANDISNLGGGYVVCGAAEEKDEHGFQRVRRLGLTAAKLKEIEGEVLTLCQRHVSPSIQPVVHVLDAESPDRKVLVFQQPGTRSAHLFRSKGQHGAYFVRNSKSTWEARNGILTELLTQKGEVEPWDKQVVPDATADDIDMLVLRETLVRMNRLRPDRPPEYYVSETNKIHEFVPPFLAREPQTGLLRPRRFVILLFGRETQRFIPGAFTLFSIYPGIDKSERHSERHELLGSLIQQTLKLRSLLADQCTTLFDKGDPQTPNRVKYPEDALVEAMVNVLAHRDYSLGDPVRISVFSDRIELLSPGRIARALSSEKFQRGEATPSWRSQSLAWFLKELQFAQGEGQGLPTIKRRLLENGSPAPVFELGPESVQYTIFARRPSTEASPNRSIELLILLREFAQANALLEERIRKSGYDSETVILLSRVLPSLRAWKKLEEHARVLLNSYYVGRVRKTSAVAEAAFSGALWSARSRTKSMEALALSLLHSARTQAKSTQDSMSVLEASASVSPFEGEPLLADIVSRFPETRSDPTFIGSGFSILSAMFARLLTALVDPEGTPETRTLAESECRSLLTRMADLVSWARKLPADNAVRIDVEAKFAKIQEPAAERGWL